ncbi:hypothetical protein KC19_N041000 [Ceratodon purpureus]|nr:hypothetical protein KC19_N041000 [Ceratodon purpureus]
MSASADRISSLCQCPSSSPTIRLLHKQGRASTDIPVISLPAIARLHPLSVQSDLVPSHLCRLLCRAPSTMSGNLEKLILEDLDEAAAKYFTIRIAAKNRPTRLRVPADFTEATGWPRVAQCFVLTSSRSRTEWPLHMTQLSSSTCVGTAISDSAGWLNFMEHMPVSVGDILCFEIVDERTLVASIAYHRGRPPQIAVEKPQEVNVNAPHFRKKLRASHTRPHKSARLDIPTSFWRYRWAAKFDGSLLTLSGPVREHVVKSGMCVTAKQTFCFFGMGWSDFIAMNDLKIGDTLLFTQVTECRYEVKKE